MVTRLQLSKLDKAFVHLDINGNGQVERDEIMALASRLLLCFRISPASSMGREVLDTYEQLWREIAECADADADGMISLVEWRRGMINAFLVGDARGKMLRPTAEAMVSVCDRDGDGVLDESEFAQMHMAFGTPRRQVAIAFRKLDTSGDGLLSTAELVDAAWDFYTSPNPKAPGNWLFGALV